MTYIYLALAVYLTLPFKVAATIAFIAGIVYAISKPDD